MTPGELVPPPAAMLWYELRERHGLGLIPEPPLTRDLADALDCSIQSIANWLTVLEGAGLVERGPDAPGQRRSLTLKESTRTERFRPCARCQRRERKKGTGRMCGRCKVLMSKDYRWRREAIRMRQEGHAEMQIRLKLAAKYPEITLFGKPPDPDEPGSRGVAGLIEVLDAAGLASEEWREALVERGGSLSQRRMRRSRNKKGE